MSLWAEVLHSSPRKQHKSSLVQNEVDCCPIIFRTDNSFYIPICAGFVAGKFLWTTFFSPRGIQVSPVNMIPQTLHTFLNF